MVSERTYLQEIVYLYAFFQVHLELSKYGFSRRVPVSDEVGAALKLDLRLD